MIIRYHVQMQQLRNKQILLGVTGGIAAYKSAELLRRLQDQGAEVRVVMTTSACEFITPLTMQALSGNPVHLDLLDTEAEAAMGHIELARWADAIVIAPASANTIAKLAQGQSDDLLSTVCLASSKPLFVVPAMNQQMWANSSTQNNIQILEDRELNLLGPAAGSQACGDVGMGRMLEPDDIVDTVIQFFQTGKLAGKRVMITAGPTREPIDPVRYITNRSSGRMGYAIAQAAVEAGAIVDLVSGPVHIDAPQSVELYKVESAEEMHTAVIQNIAETDIFIATAAVADYRVQQTALKKIKKEHDQISLDMIKNPDILADVAEKYPNVFTVGFAAETHDVEDYAKAKLQKKKLNMIAANQVGKDIGFNSEDNALHIFWQDGEKVLPQQSKHQLARELIEIITQQNS